MLLRGTHPPLLLDGRSFCEVSQILLTLRGDCHGAGSHHQSAHRLRFLGRHYHVLWRLMIG